MLNQKSVFLKSEGDRWHDRNMADANLDRLKRDPVMQCLRELNVKDCSVLEVGCGNGWRLEQIRSNFNSSVYGVEPSGKAVDEGKSKGIEIIQTTADNLVYNDSFDIIILGYCMYLCDRRDLFKIGYEVDRCLSDGGMVIIYDFYSQLPYFNEYSHVEGVKSFKFDYKKMFAWNPEYHIVYERIYNHSELDNQAAISPDDCVSVSALKKSESLAYIANPYKGKE